MPLFLHDGIFAETMAFLGSEEQQKKYVPLSLNLNIVGCYAQTELGHGSNVQGLETTATLDLKTDEWVIHTPHIKATKFWPGDMGQNSTHAFVFAKMIVGDNTYGVQPYLVQIRSMETHQPLDGITVGDIGKKMGMNSTDNGFLSFDHFRIPRENLLSRFTYVDKEGNFELRGDIRALYQIMVNTRILVLEMCSVVMARALTIATRYAVCRRQFKTMKGSSKERKLLDYQTHMTILGPHVAAEYINYFLTRAMRKLQEKSNALISDEGSYEMLDILHHLTSGFKAYITE